MSKILDFIAYGIGFLMGFVLVVPILATGILTIVLAMVTFFPFVVGCLILRAIGANGGTVKLYREAWATVVGWPLNKGIEAGDAIFGVEE